MSKVQLENDGWWNSEHDIYTWPISIGEWGARIECHGLNPDDAKALAQRVITAFTLNTPTMTQVPHELLTRLFHAQDVVGRSATEKHHTVFRAADTYANALKELRMLWEKQNG